MFQGVRDENSKREQAQPRLLPRCEASSSAFECTWETPEDAEARDIAGFGKQVAGRKFSLRIFAERGLEVKNYSGLPLLPKLTWLVRKFLTVAAIERAAALLEPPRPEYRK